MSKAKKVPANRSSSKEAKLTPKEALSVFLCFLLIFTCVGYLRGKSIKSNNGYPALAIVNNLVPGQDQHGKFFTYNCPNASVIYYIDDKSIHDTRFITVTQPSSTLLDTITPVFKDQVLIDAFIGGATAWTIKDAIQYITSSGKYEKGIRASEIAIAIFGGFSGYNLGYYIAIHNQSACDSDEMKKWSRDPTVWAEVAHLAWAGEYNPVREMRPYLDICALAAQYDTTQPHPKSTTAQAIRGRMNDIEHRTSRVTYDLKTQDFTAIKQLSDDIQPLRRIGSFADC